MVVESLKAEGSRDGEAERFELKNGEFGKDEDDKRSAASEITADNGAVEAVGLPSLTRGAGCRNGNQDRL